MRKGDRKKPGSNPFGVKYLMPKGLPTGDDVELLTMVSTEPEMRDAEIPFRKLTRAVKEGRATPEMASDYSKCAAIAIKVVHREFLTGKKVRAGLKKGDEAAHGTPEQKRIIRAEYQRLIAKKQEQNIRLSHWGACGLVAKDKGCSQKTIYRYTQDSRKLSVDKPNDCP